MNFLKNEDLIVERDCHNDFWLVQFLKDAARYYFYLQFRKRVRDIFSFVYQTVIEWLTNGMAGKYRPQSHFRTTGQRTVLITTEDN